MPCLISLLLFIGPRATAFFLWLFTGWFHGVFQTVFWPLVGFLFAPWALLWYSVVVNAMGGEWNIVTVSVMGFALLVDLAGGGAASSGT